MYIIALLIMNSDAPEFEGGCHVDVGQDVIRDQSKSNIRVIWIIIAVISLLILLLLLGAICSYDCNNPALESKLPKPINLALGFLIALASYSIM